MSIARCYSETFVKTSAVNNWRMWVVPAKKRASVRFVSIANGGGAAGFVQIQAGGVIAYHRSIPAVLDTTLHEVRWNVYAGETIGVFITVEGFFVHVTGFLFDDPENAHGPPGITLGEDSPSPLPKPRPIAAA